MIDRERLRSLVAQRMCEVHEEVELLFMLGGGASLAEKPYAIYGSPINKYAAMNRLLRDSHYEYLNLTDSAALKDRAKRQQIYLRYLDELRRESGALLSLQAQSGAADRAQIQRNRNAINSALRKLRLVAWMHRLHLRVSTNRVDKALDQITNALGFGQLLQMPRQQTA